MGLRNALIVLTAVIVATLASVPIAAPAAASLRQDVRAGETLAERLQAGRAVCDDLTADDLEHLGEYVMDRMAGGLALHDAMNVRMRTVMGAGNEKRMHVLLGQRFGRCASGGGPMLGPGMSQRRGWSGNGAWGPMMDSRGWGWMRDGAWQHMSRAEWERVGERLLGPGATMRASGGGWTTRDTLLAVLATLLAAALVGAVMLRRPWRRSR